MMTGVRAVNGFYIRNFLRESKEKGEIKTTFIFYTIDGNFFLKSKYRNLDDIKLQKIKNKLKDLTGTNKQAKELCQSISLVTIIDSVENIVFNS